MQIDKQQIIAKLTELGQHDKAPQADQSCLTRSTPTSTPVPRQARHQHL